MDITQLISSIEVELEAAIKRRQKAKAEIQLILDAASQEGRSSLSDMENDRTQELFALIDTAKAAEKGIRSKLENARKVQAEDEQLDEDVANASRSANLPKARKASESRFVVTSEERTYNPGSDPRGEKFLGDVVRQFVSNDVNASSRLQRHMNEERVERAGEQSLRTAGDLNTTGGTGLVIPQYLVDLTAPHTTSMRPFADQCNGHILPPDGMTLNIPRVTTASSVTKQSAELGDAAAVSLVTDDLQVGVLTTSGRQNVSRQAIDRGTGLEDVVLQDLFAEYASNLDAMLFTTASTGLQAFSAAGTSKVSAGGASTAVDLYPFIMGAASKVATALIGRGQPDLVVMRPNRWFWMTSELTSEWPLINTGGFAPRTAGSATDDSSASSGLHGRLPNGLGVLTDANVPSTLDTAGVAGTGVKDAIYVVSTRECHLWEEAGQPAYIRAEQPLAANLGVQLVVYGYFAFTYDRYANSTALVYDVADPSASF